MKNIKKKKSGGYGIIMTLLFTLYAFLAEKAKNSITAKIFNTDENAKPKSGISVFFNNLFPKETLLKMRRRISSVLCHNPIQAYMQKIFDALFSCRSRDYGIFLLSFGLYSILGSVVGKYFLSVDEQGPFSVAIAVGCIVFSFVLLRERRAIGTFALENIILHFIFFDLLGVRKYDIPKEVRHAPAGLALLLGMGLGLMSFVTNISVIVFGILFLALAFWIFRIPEAGVVTIFFVFFLFDIKYTAIAVLLTLLSYLSKLLQMKRTGKFGYIDFWVILFSAVFFFSELTSDKSASMQMFISSFFILAFFLTKNLIRTFEWIKRCFMACVFSLTCVSLNALFQAVTCHHGGIVKSLLYAAENGVNSFFETTEHLALYLLCIIPFSAVTLYNRKNISEKRTSSFVFFIAVISLMFTVSYGAYFAAFLTFYIFLVIYSKKTFAYAFVSVLPVITVYSIASQFERTSLFNISSDTKLISDAFTQSLQTTLKYPLSGIGVSTQRDIFTPFYTALSSELGIPCLIVFIIIAFMFIRKCVSYLCFKREYGKYNYYISAPLASCFALLIHGFYSSSMLSPAGILLLFMTMGMGLGICDYVLCENETLTEYGRSE